VSSCGWWRGDSELATWASCALVCRTRSSLPGDIFFTNLLEDPDNEYVIGSSHISGEDCVPQAQVINQMSPPQGESKVRKTQRGANFSIQEDNLLVSACLNVNQDVMQSTNKKKKGTYWNIISEYYHKLRIF